MLKRQACAKFQSQIFDESEVIQILKVVRWHFCQVYKSGVRIMGYSFHRHVSRRLCEIKFACKWMFASF